MKICALLSTGSQLLQFRQLPSELSCELVIEVMAVGGGRSMEEALGEPIGRKPEVDLLQPKSGEEPLAYINCTPLPAPLHYRAWIRVGETELWFRLRPQSRTISAELQRACDGGVRLPMIGKLIAHFVEGDSHRDLTVLSQPEIWELDLGPASPTFGTRRRMTLPEPSKRELSAIPCLEPYWIRGNI